MGEDGQSTVRRISRIGKARKVPPFEVKTGMALNEGEFGEGAVVRTEKGQGYSRCQEPQRISVLKFCFLFSKES